MRVALVLAGGVGTRMGGEIPKQYLLVNGRMIISYCLETFLLNDNIDAIQIVADESWCEALENEIQSVVAFASKRITLNSEADIKGEIRDKSALELLKNKFKGISKPGVNRQLSIVNGLKDLKAYAGSDAEVIIHDAARPLLSDALIDRCFDSLANHDGVMPVLQMKDTIYVSQDGKTVSNLLDRNTLFAGQAPECYRLDNYLKACESLMPDAILKINGSTEPAILAGLDVAMVPGDENNYKITTQEDLQRFTEYVSDKA